MNHRNYEEIPEVLALQREIDEHLSEIIVRAAAMKLATCQLTRFQNKRRLARGVKGPMILKTA